MLRPSSRAAILRGVPTLAIALFTAVLLSNEALREDISSTYKQLREDIVERPELYVQVMEITGATARVDRQVRLSAGLDLPVSSFEVDLPEIRLRLEKLDAVKSVSVHLRAGGILQVDVTERVPVLLWRGPTGLEAVDVDGVRTAYVDQRSNYPGLPLIVGAGAKLEVEEALHLFREMRPIAEKVRALRRISQRRWDIVLDQGQVIKLPQERPGRALGHVIAMHNSHDIFTRGVTAVDLRDLRRPVVRVQETSNAQEVLVTTSASLTESE